MDVALSICGLGVTVMRMREKPSRPSAMVARALLFALIWWVLSGGVMSSWWIGVPAVLLALSISMALVAPLPLKGWALLGFVPFFLIRSLLGGVDVAWRAFHPRMPIDPDSIEYRLRLPAGLAQVFMVNAVNLLPGTLSADLNHNVLQVHVLTRSRFVEIELATLESHVARLFGLSLDTAGGGQ